jgi:hypothetical protein
MARRKKAKEPKTIKTTAAEFQQAVREANGASVRAKNASSSKSTAVTDFCTKSGFANKPFGIILQLEAMEDIKRDETVRQILMGYELMGWGKQQDMFDDIGDRIAAAKKAAEEEDWKKARPNKGSEGLPLDEAAKRFGQTAHKAPSPPKAQRSEDAPTVVFPDPPAPSGAEAVA